MTDLGVVRVVVLEDEFADVVDVEVVRLAVAEAVVRELRVLDRDRAVRAVAGEDAVFVVVEVAVTNGEVRAFLANAGAVLIDHFGAEKFDVLDRRVVARNDPNRFAAVVFPGRIELGETSHASQSQAVLVHGANIARVRARIDFDDVSVTGRRDGRTRRRVCFSGTNLKRRGRYRGSSTQTGDNQESC